MPMPRSWGGPEVDMLQQVEILEVLARADASAAWCAMIGSDGGFYSASAGCPGWGRAGSRSGGSP
jgi:indole-3-acetate monooxygenase